MRSGMQACQGKAHPLRQKGERSGTGPVQLQAQEQTAQMVQMMNLEDKKKTDSATATGIREWRRRAVA